MGLADWLMQRWALAEHRRDLCQRCHRKPRDAATFEGRYCGPGCQVADAEDQAFGL